MTFLHLLMLAALAPLEGTGPIAYRCLDDTRFTLVVTPALAIVRFPDREYRLPRRKSALARKYATEKATLYLDQEFAAFVADDRELPGCFIDGSGVAPGAPAPR